MTDSVHVVIVGAGFAGLTAVTKLRKTGVRVTVIDKNLYSTFQPLLYQVATGGLNPGDVSYAIGGYAREHHARYERGELTAIDSEKRQITLADGREIAYDYLVLATGVSSSHFGIKGAEQYTYGSEVSDCVRNQGSTSQPEAGPANANSALEPRGPGAQSNPVLP